MLQTSLMQSLLTRITPSSPKQVELTPGQVFKGTVVKLYPDSTALVQVGGMQVHAKLEANLEAGQKAWLQVQPSSDVVTLKVLSTPQNTPDATLEGLMNSLGLAETKENRSIVQALVNGNLPINKELVQAFAQIAKSQGLSDATIEAFLLAVKRNLPLTNDAVGSLKAFLSDQTLTKSIWSFLQQAEGFLQTDGKSGTEKLLSQPPLLPTIDDAQTNGGPAQSANRAADPLSNSSSSSIVRNFESARNDQSANQPTGSNTTASGTAGQTLRQTIQLLADKLTSLPLTLASQDESAGLHMPQQNINIGLEPGSTEEGRVDGLQRAAAKSLENLISAGKSPSTEQAKQQNVQIEPNTMTQQGLTKPLSSPAFPSAGDMTKQSADQMDLVGRSGSEKGLQSPSAAGSRQDTAAQQSIHASAGDLNRLVQTDTSHTKNTTINPVRGGGEQTALPANAIRDLFLHLGLMHERQIIQRAISPVAFERTNDGRFESVKSLLLQITQAPANAVPSTLREAADSLLQQITGQQLMMTQPNVQTISQLVMQLPLKTEHGEETAFVQIEAKKGEGGQLDSENCRLFFNLDLQQLGITMVDVTIVNRIINVQIFNDQPWLDALAYQMKDKFAVQLRDTGYQLSSMRVMPLPEVQPKTFAQQAKENLMNEYKGVDFRI